jgi:hypothetical protein
VVSVGVVSRLDSWERRRESGTGRVEKKVDSRMQRAEEGRHCMPGSGTLEEGEQSGGAEAGARAEGCAVDVGECVRRFSMQGYP